MQHWTLQQVIDALRAIKEKGWIRANREHNTWIWKTLEDHLGITENNIDLPDFWVMELKSQRRATKSMITLFTRKPEWTTNQEILTKFWYPDKEHPDINVLHQTLCRSKNAQWFYILQEDDKILIYKNDEVIGYYSTELLLEKAKAKIWDWIILVIADERKVGDFTEFRYEEAYLLDWLSTEKLLSEVLYDIRMWAYKSGPKKWKPHDHWSGFRIKQASIPMIFNVYRKIL